MRTYGLSRYDEEVERVLQELQKKITALEKKVAELEKKQEPIPAPAWFVKEFGSGDLGGLISDPHFTVEGWRALAVALRAQKAQK
jgi:peptidoglycan L-alanyl-D-glutamate endopeptidase CwlK